MVNFNFVVETQHKHANCSLIFGKKLRSSPKNKYHHGYTVDPNIIIVFQMLRLLWISDGTGPLQSDAHQTQPELLRTRWKTVEANGPLVL